jgi:hypothetical protein
MEALFGTAEAVPLSKTNTEILAFDFHPSQQSWPGTPALRSGQNDK